MNFYQLPSGEIAGFDNPAQAPAGATEITAEEFSQIATMPVLTVGQAQANQVANLSAACSVAIASGFTSSALGTAYSYPSTLTDQSNQSTIAGCMGGGLLWCENSVGVWALVQHTQSQAQSVVASFTTWLNECQHRLVTLTENVSSAATVAAVQAVVWS